jgi:ABC-type microcin C transport system permease subunit YejB
MSDENKADERILALMRAREEGEREGRIAGMAEAAQIAHDVLFGDHYAGASGARQAIVAELRRRFGVDDPRVLHHLRMRGLE